MCLQSKDGISLRDIIRNHVSDEELVEIIEKSIRQKPEGHCMNVQRIEAEGMCQIGG